MFVAMIASWIMHIANAMVAVPSFLEWGDFITWLGAPAAVLVVVQFLKLVESAIRIWTGKEVPAGQGILDRWALPLTYVVSFGLQLLAYVLQSVAAPDPTLWVALQAFFAWAVSTLFYVGGKAVRGRAGGLGR